MKPSNPARFWVSGSNLEAFSYEPGALPFYVIGRSKSHVPLSVMVFANDDAHARKIIEHMMDFADACNVKYVASKAPEEDRHDLIGLYRRRTQTARKCLTGEDGYTLHIGLIDPSQLHKIGWASNDSII